MAAIRWGTMAARNGSGAPAFWMGAAVERRAVKRTLLEMGYLKIRGGPVSTPLSAGQEDSVS